MFCLRNRPPPNWCDNKYITGVSLDATELYKGNLDKKGTDRYNLKKCAPLNRLSAHTYKGCIQILRIRVSDQFNERGQK
eukprot:snap_masked-scaffold_18-processed-gene-3.38-mRNA-1 protein AED:1.00 eAED:1.00 QI:0/0/0/0/1/1/2/0/78